MGRTAEKDGFMILVTGGMGFIGQHTARALLDLGESCVLTQHRAARDAGLIGGEIGTRAFIEPLDITDTAAFLEIGSRHEITGIVHLAGPGIGTPDPVDGFRAGTQGLLNVLQAAREWSVPRVGIASTIGVYAGTTADNPIREDLPLPMVSPHQIVAHKKSDEIIAGSVASRAGFEAVSLRIAGVWGPRHRHPRSNLGVAPLLVQAAVGGRAPDFSPPLSPAYAGDGGDLCYAKDCGRAIALLQTAPKLNHAAYNVGSGRATTNGDLAAAIRHVIPDAAIELPEGRDPRGPGRAFYLDITRIHQDTGYQPEYDTGRGVADYIDWLRSGHDH
jgi:UDP-glucose 4-epimerase